MMKKFIFGFALLTLFSISSCHKDSINTTPSTPTSPKSSTKSITSFVFEVGKNTGKISQDVAGTINGTTITVTLPAGTNATNLIPTIIHNGKSISPDPNMGYNFTNAVNFSVMAEDSTKQLFTVSTTITPSPTVKDTVLSKVMTSTNGVKYKVYYNAREGADTRKGIVLMGAGNDESDPYTASEEDPTCVSTAILMAQNGYVGVVVGYKDEPPLNGTSESWIRNIDLLASDFSEVANLVINEFGNGLNRSKVICGGYSYASIALLSNIAISNTLSDTKGLLAACAATSVWASQNLKIPIFNIVCSNNPEVQSGMGEVEGSELYSQLSGAIKTNSNYYIDNSCTTHCGGAGSSLWNNKMLEQVKKWIP